MIAILDILGFWCSLGFRVPRHPQPDLVFFMRLAGPTGESQTGSTLRFALEGRFSGVVLIGDGFLLLVTAHVFAVFVSVIHIKDFFPFTKK